MSNIIFFLLIVLVGKAQEVFLPESVLPFVKPVWLALLVGSVGQFILGRPAPPGFTYRRPMVRYWIIFSICLLLSVPFTVYFKRSFEFMFYTYLSLSFLCFMIVRNLDTVASLEKTTIALLIAVFIMSVGMIVKPNEFKEDEDGPKRYFVTLTYDPNDIGLFFCMSVPLCYYWFWRGGLFTKLAIAPLGALCLLGVYLTGSRGALVTVGMVILYLAFAVKESGMLLRILVIVGFVVGAAGMSQSKTMSKLIEGVTGQEYNFTDESGRIAIWKRGLGYLAQRPITGVGVACFETADFVFRPEANTTKVANRTAHNCYLQVATENGVFAFIIWMCLFVSAFREVGRQRKQLQGLVHDEETVRYLMLGSMFRAMLFGFLIGGFFLSVGYFQLLYVTFAYIVALGNIGDNWIYQLSLAPAARPTPTFYSSWQPTTDRFGSYSANS